MADTACMLPKWDRADMKLLNIIDGADCEFPFFCNCKADNQNKNSWDKKALTDNPRTYFYISYYFLKKLRTSS